MGCTIRCRLSPSFSKAAFISFTTARQMLGSKQQFTPTISAPERTNQTKNEKNLISCTVLRTNEGAIKKCEVKTGDEIVDVNLSIYLKLITRINQNIVSLLKKNQTQKANRNQFYCLANRELLENPQQWWNTNATLSVRTPALTRPQSSSCAWHEGKHGDCQKNNGEEPGGFSCAVSGFGLVYLTTRSIPSPAGK